MELLYSLRLMMLLFISVVLRLLLLPQFIYGQYINLFLSTQLRTYPSKKSCFLPSSPGGWNLLFCTASAFFHLLGLAAANGQRKANVVALECSS